MSDKPSILNLDAKEKTIAAASVTMNFVSKRKIEAAVQAYSRLDVQDRPGFVNFLVGRKIITPHDVKILKEYPTKKVLRCPSCPQEFDISDIKPGLQFECPSCSSLVTVPLDGQNFDIFELSEKELPFAKPDSFSPPVYSQASANALNFEDIRRELAKQGFSVIRQIGRGGMGVVYLAEDSKLGRMVALKVLIAGAFASESQVSRFEREARAVAALKHPNIVSILSLGQFRGQKYYTMDYIEGASLDVSLVNKRYTFSETVNLCSDICKAVHYAHQEKIIHRDLKPANILLDKTGKPFITDFGLAKLEDKSKSLTESGIALGTPHYMSPEQASGEVSSVSRVSDVYSIGVILYELLSGKVPHDAKNAVDIMVKVMNEDPHPPSFHNKSIPPELEAICLKAMSRKPENRYSTALELAEDLDSFLSGHTVMARPPGIVKKTFKLVKKMKTVLFVLVVIGLSVGLTFIFSSMLNDKDNSQDAIITALLDARQLVDSGDYKGVYQILGRYKDSTNARVISSRSKLNDLMLSKMRQQYSMPTESDKQAVLELHQPPEGSQAEGLYCQAFFLSNLLEYYPEENITHDYTVSFESSVSLKLTEIYNDKEQGPLKAGNFFEGILELLGKNEVILDEVKDELVATLLAEVEVLKGSSDTTEKAIERLQVLALLFPGDEKYTNEMADLRSNQLSSFIESVSTLFKTAGIGVLRVEGAYYDSLVEIICLSEELGNVNMDTRDGTYIRLKNGLYKLRFRRDGYEPIDRNIAVKANQELVVTIEDAEWKEAE